MAGNDLCDALSPTVAYLDVVSVDTLFKLVFALLVLREVPVDDLQELLAQIYGGGSVEWRVIKSYYPLSLRLLSFLWRLKLQFVFVSTFVECSLVDRYGFVEDSFIA